MKVESSNFSKFQSEINLPRKRSKPAQSSVEKRAARPEKQIVPQENSNNHSKRNDKEAESHHSVQIVPPKPVFNVIQDCDLLEHSPFNFSHGIEPKRLLKARCPMLKNDIVKTLSCAYCAKIIV